MFSLSFCYKALSLFFRYPMAIPTGLRGLSSVSMYIEKSARRRQTVKPITFKRVYGFDIFLNPRDFEISALIAYCSSYEPETTELIRKLLKPGMTVVDVGANLGWYTLMAARIVGGGGTVIAFEPETNNFELLARSVYKNGFGNVKLFQQCVSNVEGKVKLYLSPGSAGGHSLKWHAGSPEVYTQSVSLDAALSRLNIGSIDLLKIDVQGGEPEVLLGARRYLMRTRHIIMEWNPGAWDDGEEVLNLLFDSFDGYRIVRSPFLIKRCMKDSLRASNGGNFYFRSFGSGF